MSYQVIARKWRPQAFEEVTGQDHITRTLRNAIEHDRLHHAYVFSGARGVGKTTTARLFAKALNCHKTDSPNPNPCSSKDAEICPSCLEISESRSIDVLEFDAASNTGVQDIRDIILENINVAAARDRFKIFIIDEVHMLSPSSFNALLKTVEEPPKNVVFIMATTELHKIPDTITSRSQEFIFRTIPQVQIFERLRLIADAEKIDISDDALKVIARSGEGSMRDAQSNFDQVISFSGENISVDDVSGALGLAGAEILEKIISSIATADSKTVLAVVDDLVGRGQDLRNFCRDVLAVIRDILIFKVSGEVTLVESSVLSEIKLREYSEAFTEADLTRLFHSLAETETKLKDAIQSRFVLEIGLVRLVELRRLQPIESIIERLAALEGGVASHSPTQPTAVGAPEKKTLKSEESDSPKTESPRQIADPQQQAPPEPVFEEPDLGIDDRTFDEPESFEPEFVAPPLPPQPVKFSTDLSFVNSLPVKLPPISAEDLEHVDDKWLDAAFELKIERSGELRWLIPHASELARSAIGSNVLTETAAAANGNGSAAAPARQPLKITIPDFSDEDVGELPVLSADPSEDEMIIYANAHPSIRRAMRIFRAKITGASKL
jgi:DNA polymerase-3 subunit gamma/tau